MSKKEQIYYENFKDAVERNKKKIPEVHKKLKSAGVKYVLSSWIDLHGIKLVMRLFIVWKELFV